jgi:hypothetical protein
MKNQMEDDYFLIDMGEQIKKESGETGDSKETEESSEKKEYVIENWDDFDIKNDLLRGIYSMGFEKPSPIQKKPLNLLLWGKILSDRPNPVQEKPELFPSELYNSLT